MAEYRKIAIADYAYKLPEELVPKFPTLERDGARLLAYTAGTIKDDMFANIANHIRQGTLMVFNNTKVIRARLAMQKSTGAKLEVFCLEPFLPSDYATALQSTGECEWLCMVGNLKKWKEGSLSMSVGEGDSTFTLFADKEERIGKDVRVRFRWSNPSLAFGQVLELAGSLPIPPYLKRETAEEDYSRYQTVYSRHEGSVAAPTAGLHFTDSVFGALQQKGVERREITLHVGAGTFLPVQSDTLEGHAMHTEHIVVTRDFISRLRLAIGQVTAVGTTSVRTLESLFWLAAKLHNGGADLKVEQWDPYSVQTNLSPMQALDVLESYCAEKKVDLLCAETQLMIVPGYEWKFVTQIVTNFHQPESTLLLLVSAFVGDDWKRIYSHAKAHSYRFLSYGDSSILTK